MYQAGDENNGFSIQQHNNLLRVRMWGFWEQNHLDLLLDALGGLQEKPPNTTGILLDITQLKPQRETGQEALRAIATLPKALGFSYAAVIFDNILGKLQFARIAKETTCTWIFFRSEEAALSEFQYQQRRTR